MFHNRPSTSGPPPQKRKYVRKQLPQPPQFVSSAVTSGPMHHRMHEQHQQLDDEREFLRDHLARNDPFFPRELEPQQDVVEQQLQFQDADWTPSPAKKKGARAGIPIGSHPPWPEYITRVLDDVFINCQFINEETKKELAKELDLTTTQVKDWFNRRRRHALEAHQKNSVELPEQMRILNEAYERNPILDTDTKNRLLDVTKLSANLISNYFIKRYKKEQKEAGIPYEAGHYVRRRRVYEEEEEFENNGIGTPHYDEDGNYVGDYVEVVEEIPDWDQEVYNQAERKRRAELKEEEDKLLDEQFAKNPFTTGEELTEFAKKLNRPRPFVLKWFWKKRKRLGIEREVPPQQDGKNELLENIFEKHQFVNQKIKEKIAERTNMKPLAVQMWFKKRRDAAVYAHEHHGYELPCQMKLLDEAYNKCRIISDKDRRKLMKATKLTSNYISSYFMHRDKIASRQETENDTTIQMDDLNEEDDGEGADGGSPKKKRVLTKLEEERILEEFFQKNAWCEGQDLIDMAKKINRPTVFLSKWFSKARRKSGVKRKDPEPYGIHLEPYFQKHQFVDGAKYNELAEIAGVNPTTVKSWYMRRRLRAQKAHDEHGEELPCQMKELQEAFAGHRKLSKGHFQYIGDKIGLTANFVSNYFTIRKRMSKGAKRGERLSDSDDDDDEPEDDGEEKNEEKNEEEARKAAEKAEKAQKMTEMLEAMTEEERQKYQDNVLYTIFQKTQFVDDRRYQEISCETGMPAEEIRDWFQKKRVSSVEEYRKDGKELPKQMKLLHESYERCPMLGDDVRYNLALKTFLPPKSITNFFINRNRKTAIKMRAESSSVDGEAEPPNNDGFYEFNLEEPAPILRKSLRKPVPRILGDFGSYPEKNGSETAEKAQILKKNGSETAEIAEKAQISEKKPVNRLVIDEVLKSPQKSEKIPEKAQEIEEIEESPKKSEKAPEKPQEIQEIPKKSEKAPEKPQEIEKSPKKSEKRQEIQEIPQKSEKTSEKRPEIEELPTFFKSSAPAQTPEIISDEDIFAQYESLLNAVFSEFQFVDDRTNYQLSKQIRIGMPQIREWFRKKRESSVEEHRTNGTELPKQMKLLHEAYQRCPLLDEDARRDLVEKTQLLPKWVTNFFINRSRKAQKAAENAAEPSTSDATTTSDDGFFDFNIENPVALTQTRKSARRPAPKNYDDFFGEDADLDELLRATTTNPPAAPVATAFTKIGSHIIISPSQKHKSTQTTDFGPKEAPKEAPKAVVETLEPDTSDEEFVADELFEFNLDDFEPRPDRKRPAGPPIYRPPPKQPKLSISKTRILEEAYANLLKDGKLTAHEIATFFANRNNNTEIDQKPRIHMVPKKE
ncbi:Homeobox domain-containing protein [Caenorhabditis elegans]|uniref:Homeobox domain-containing protein n=1 Tax=Caenorhabditis elegans TaxID=6239 RepID=Q7K714_CAEEL|nr:Homeobox domain-containing protein [Caenorhabditis elegans]CAE46683.1 Homeobox domain-containing protein [Caenorhabditis elegans]|eukprot:NP_001022429.1 C. Elegans Homeobox [Caenorhabditis elegans]